ncbi:hypothetical protein ABTD17_19085, partial [Acinetobacter baumannii]
LKMTYDLAKLQTNMSQEWLQQMAAANPATPLPSGNVRVFARGAFVNVASPAKDRIENGVTKKGSYGMNLLFLPNYDLTAL